MVNAWLRVWKLRVCFRWISVLPVILDHNCWLLHPVRLVEGRSFAFLVLCHHHWNAPRIVSWDFLLVRPLPRGYCVSLRQLSLPTQIHTASGPRAPVRHRPAFHISVDHLAFNITHYHVICYFQQSHICRSGGVGGCWTASSRCQFKYEVTSKAETL